MDISKKYSSAVNKGASYASSILWVQKNLERYNSNGHSIMWAKQNKSMRLSI